MFRKSALVLTLLIPAGVLAAAGDDQSSQQPPSQQPPAQRLPGVGVPSQAPRPIKSINPSSTPPLKRRGGGFLSPDRPGAQTPPPTSGGGRPPIIIIPGSRDWSGRWPVGSDGVGIHIGDDAGVEHNWHIQAHIGSPSIATAKRRYWWRYPYWGYSHWCWWNDWRYPIGLGWDYTDAFLQIELQNQYDKARQERLQYERAEAERFEHLTDLEKARELQGQGVFDKASTYYLKHIEAAPEDALAIRGLAVALLQTRKVDQGVAMMAMAYRKSPALAQTPVDAGLIPGGNAAIRRLSNAAVNQAHRTKSPSAWLTAVVMAQCEGRTSAAQSLLSKAKDAGLDAPIAQAFDLALNVKPAVSQKP